MTTLKTACPNCLAVFKITPEQLKLKNGRVRCGKCHTVFQADENLIGAAPAPSQPAASMQPPTHSQTASSQTNMPQKPDAKSMQEALSAPIGNHGINERGHGSSNSVIPDAPLDDEFDALFNDDSLKRKSTKSEAAFDIDEDGVFHDDIDIEADLENDKDLGNMLGGNFTQEFEDTFGNFPSVSHTADSEKNLSADSDEGWLDELLTDDGSPFADDPNAVEQPEDLVGFLEEIGANTAQFSAVSNTTQFTRDLAAVSNEEAPHVRAPLKSKKASKSVGSLVGLVLWTLLSIGLLLTLLGQYFYFNFDTLAKDPAKQAQLHSICGIVGCTVPNPDASSIAITKLNRFQDDDAGKTRVTFEVVNNQNTPALVPSLKVLLKKDGNIVGGNVIKPKGYLSTDYRRLPPTQPIDGEIRISSAFKSFDGVEIVPLY